jgi:hypothetical protein
MMRKNPVFQSDVCHARALAAFLFCSLGAFRAMSDGSVTDPPALMGGSGAAFLGDAWTWGVPTTPVQLTSVVSTKSHGNAGNYEIDFPLSGTRGVECRNGGTNGDYWIIFTFNCALTTVDSATVSCGSVSSSSIGPGGTNQYTVNLTGENACNGQYITVTLNNVNDSCGNHSDTVSSPEMGLLLGDVNANGIVSNTDASLVGSQIAAPVTYSNFRNDVNVNGVITSTDRSLTKGQAGTSLPFPP